MGTTKICEDVCTAKMPLASFHLNTLTIESGVSYQNLTTTKPNTKRFTGAKETSALQLTKRHYQAHRRGSHYPLLKSNNNLPVE